MLSLEESTNLKTNSWPSEPPPTENDRLKSHQYIHWHGHWKDEAAAWEIARVICRKFVGLKLRFVLFVPYLRNKDGWSQKT